MSSPSLSLRVLTIAGSDPSGAAGVQMDLKTFAALGCVGSSAVTAVTVQTGMSFSRRFDLPASLVQEQVASVLAESPVHSIKIGMLGTREVVRSVAEVISSTSVPVVLDPVLRSTTGSRLLDEDAIPVLVEELLPLATVATPNREELAQLAAVMGEKGDLEGRCRAVRPQGGALLVTGGDTPGKEVIDVLYDGHSCERLAGRRVEKGTVRGTGCALSAALAVSLAGGAPLAEAVRASVASVRAWIAESVPCADGSRVLEPSGRLPDSR